MEPLKSESLERDVHAALRSLPDRRAPGSLAARVQAEIERRAAIPWWHKSYAYWPGWARGTFLAGAGSGVIALLVSVTVAGGFASGQVTGVLQPWLEFGRRAAGVVGWIGDFVSLLISSIPPLWLYSGLAVIAATYLSLFGLGATAYRFLWERR
jgi:hypothetical protein